MSNLLYLLACMALAASPGDLRVGKIHLQIDEVYPAVDGVEAEFPYSWANLLHVRTREEVIRRELLFKEGDPFRPELLAETERNLRRFLFLRSVRIEASPPRNGAVDVTVHTIDSWTTKLQLNLGASGGKLTASAGLVEDNLLGKGKRLSAFYIIDSARSSTRLEYHDPRLFGRFLTLTTAYSTGDDLKRLQAEFLRPFNSSLTPWAWGTSWDLKDSTEHLYELGEESASFQQTKRRGEVFVARSLGSTPQMLRRLYSGYRYAFDQFEDAPDPSFESRRQSGPYAGLLLRQIRYVREQNINTYLRDEDFNLGAQAYLELGWTPGFLGSNTAAIAWSASAAKGLRFQEGQFVLISGRLSGRGSENLRGQLRAEYYHRLDRRFTFASTAQLDALRNPDPELQILLGGEQGLRGYKLRYFSGDKSVLLRAETRYLVFEDLLKLCSVGVTAFFDVGKAWKPGDPISLSGQAANVGLGLRTSFPRSSQARTMSFDIAYAFDENGLGSRWVISFGALQGF